MRYISVVYNVSRNGRTFAIADRIPAGDNLQTHCNRYGATVCHLCRNWQEAVRVANTWNQLHRETAAAIG